MNKNKIIRWDPIENIPCKGDIEIIHEDVEGYKILIRCEDESKILKVFFDVPLVVRKTDEGDRWKTISENQVLQESTLFKVENSDLCEWLVKESSSTRDLVRLKHYLIASNDDIIDVVSEFEPVIQFIE